MIKEQLYSQNMIVGIRFYKTMGSLYDFFDSQELQLSPSNKDQLFNHHADSQEYVEEKDAWFGDPPEKSFERLKKRTTYENMALYKEVKENIRQYIDPFIKKAKQDLVNKRKLVYNPNGFGVFSFDRASLGLYKTRTRKGEVKVVSSFKNVYAYFPNRNVPKKTIRIMLGVSLSAGQAAKELVYSGLAASLAVEILEAKGLEVEMYVAFGTRDSNQDQVSTSGACVKLKRYGQRLDLPKMLYVTSSPKFYRWNVFKSHIMHHDYFGHSISQSLGNSRLFKNHAFLKDLAFHIDNTLIEPVVLGGSTDVSMLVKELTRVSDIGDKIKEENEGITQ